MTNRLAIAAAAAGLLLVAQPDFAQAQRFAPDALPPFEVATIVRSMGLDPLHRPVWRGGHYVFRAIDRMGEEVRVVVDGYSGAVLSVTPTVALGGYERRRPAYPPPSVYDDEDDEDEPQIGRLPPAHPPRVIPAPRSSAPPARSAAVTPSEPPLPRARPQGRQDASNEAAPQAAPPQGKIREIELYRKPQEPAPETETGNKTQDFPVQPLDDTPGMKPNI